MLFIQITASNISILTVGYSDRRRPALVKWNWSLDMTDPEHNNHNQKDQEENRIFVGFHRCCAHVISDLRSPMRIEKNGRGIASINAGRDFILLKKLADRLSALLFSPRASSRFAPLHEKRLMLIS